jgi:hypothetical protein
MKVDVCGGKRCMDHIHSRSAELLSGHGIVGITTIKIAKPTKTRNEVTRLFATPR